LTEPNRRPSKQTVSALLWISKRRQELKKQTRETSLLRLSDLIVKTSLPLLLAGVGIKVRTSDDGKDFMTLGNMEIPLTASLDEAEKMLIKTIDRPDEDDGEPDKA
jgi:hypothetical protein